MRKFLKTLRVVRLFWRYLPVVILPDNYWTPEDAKAWSNFLGTDTGAKLRHVRFNLVYESQLQAITDRKDSAYSAGAAFGMRSMVAFEDSLLQISLPTDEQSEFTTPRPAGVRSVNK